jgi:hypothetical protein
VTEVEVEQEDAHVFEEVVQRLSVALLALEVGDTAMTMSHLTAALEVARNRSTCLAHHLVGISD